MALETPPYVISALSHSAALFRLAAQTNLASTGVVGSGALAVTASSPANMSVNVAAGMVWIPGTLGATGGLPYNLGSQTGYGLPGFFTTQGSYCAYNDATVNLTIAAADPTNPRIDIVCASIQDAQYAGSNNQSVLQVITGTPAPSPSAPSAPASSVVLAQVAVAAAASSITAGNITATAPQTGNTPLFSATQSTGTAIAANGSWTQMLNWNPAIDTVVGYNATYNVYYSQKSGWYRATLRAGLASSPGTSYIGVGFGVISSTVTPSTQVTIPAASTNPVIQTSTVQYLAAGTGYLRPMAIQGSAAVINSAPADTEFTVEWLHP